MSIDHFGTINIVQIVIVIHLSNEWSGPGAIDEAVGSVIVRLVSRCPVGRVTVAPGSVLSPKVENARNFS